MQDNRYPGLLHLLYLLPAKKQSEVKTLTAKYGYTKMDELPDDKLAVYLEDLKEIQNG